MGAAKFVINNMKTYIIDYKNELSKENTNFSGEAAFLKPKIYKKK